MKTCKKCGSIEFYKNNRCKTCRKASYAAWRKANPDKSKAASAAWKTENPEKAKASETASRLKNAGKIKATQAVYHKANKEKIKIIKAAWRVENSEREKISGKAWRAANKEVRRVIQHNYIARKRSNGGELSKGLSARLFEMQRGKCACCGKQLGDNYHLDHRMPLALGGANEDWNMQLLAAKCNLQKRAKHPIDFMQSKGYLL